MKKAVIVISLISILFIMSSTKAFAKITAKNALRNCDPLGCGNFGASRGTRTHKGIDFVAAPGETIFAPITGTVTRYPIPYADDSRYSGIEIKNIQYTVKMFYLKPSAAILSVVTKGQPIGVAQNISAKHGSSMKNHVHFEVYDNKGNLINPTKMFN